MAESKRLFSGWILFGLIAVVALTLWLLYPRQEPALINAQTDAADLKKQFSNPLHAEYVKLTQQDNVKADALLRLATEMTEKGFWHQSNALLDKAQTVSLNDAERQQIGELRLRNRLSLYYLADSKGEQVEPAWLDVRSQLLLDRDVYDLPQHELLELAKQSVDFHLYPQASSFYEKVAQTADEPSKWYAEAAKWSQQAANPYRAERLLERAYQQATKNEQPVYKVQWLQAAIKAKQENKVADYLDQVGEATTVPEKELVPLADLSLQIARPETAAVLYRELATKQPKDAGRWYEKAAHWSNQAGLHEQAVTDWDQVIKAYPQRENEIKTKQIDALLQANQPQKALAKIKTVVTTEAAEPLLNQGIQTALAAQDTKTAREWNKAYLERKPNDTAALLRQVDIAGLDKNYSEAVQYLKKVIELAAKPEYYERWAFLAAAEGDYAKALQLWQWLNKHYPSDEYQKNLISVASASLNNGGLPVLLAIAQQQALPVQSIRDIFNTLRNQKQAQQADRFLKDYLARYPQHSELWEDLANWQMSQKQFKAARSTWEQVTERFGASEVANKGIEQAVSGQFFALVEQKSPQAGEYLQQYLQQSPHHLELWKALASWQADQKQFAQALQTWETIQARFGTDADSQKAYTDLSLALFYRMSEAGQKQQAVQFLQTYLNKVPNDRKVWEILANTQMAEKLWADALATWQQIAQRFGDDGSIALMQVQLYWDMKQSQKAYEHLSRLNNPWHLASDYQKTILSELAWKYEDWGRAITFYQHLLKQPLPNTSTETTKLHYHRLAWAQINDGQIEQGAQTLQQGFKQLADSSLIIDAMQMALDKKHTSLLQNLLALAESQEQLFQHLPQYWLIAALYIDKQGDEQQAKQFYRRAMLMPTNTPELRKAYHQLAFSYLALLQKTKDSVAFDRVRAQLEQDLTDPKSLARLYEIALAKAIDEKNNVLADELFARARQRQVVLPTWIKTVVALRQKNKVVLHELLASGEKLSLGDRFTALVILERKDEAFEFARQAMKTATTVEERQQARQLALSLADGRVASYEAAFQTQQLGDSLSIQEQRLTYRHPAKNGKPAVNVDLKRSQLKGKNGLPNQTETDIAAQLRWQKEKHQLEVTAGLNRRGDDTKPYGKVRYQQQITDKTNASIEYGMQEIATENAWLRSHGQRDRLQGRVSTKLTDKQTAELSAWNSRFSQRNNGQDLAQTQGASATWVYRDQKGEVSWYAGLQGTVEKTDYESDLTQQQRNGLPSDGTSTTILAGFNHGSPGRGVPPQGDDIHYNVSAAIGKQWKTDQLTQRLEASVGKRLTQDDELSLNMFYDRTGEQKADKGIGVQYRRWSGF